MMDAFSTMSMPLLLQWALALIGVGVGLLFILRTDGVVRGLRRWMLTQLKWLRRPGYRRMVKLYGWLLFVTGVLLIALLTILLLAGAAR